MLIKKYKSKDLISNKNLKNTPNLSIRRFAFIIFICLMACAPVASLTWTNLFITEADAAASPPATIEEFTVIIRHGTVVKSSPWAITTKAVAAIESSVKSGWPLCLTSTINYLAADDGSPRFKETAAAVKQAIKDSDCSKKATLTKYNAIANPRSPTDAEITTLVSKMNEVSNTDANVWVLSGQVLLKIAGKLPTFPDLKGWVTPYSLASCNLYKDFWVNERLHDGSYNPVKNPITYDGCDPLVEGCPCYVKPTPPPPPPSSKKRSDGTSCKKNSDCTNNACGRETAADNAPLVCCDSDKVALYDGYDYCTDMPTGSTCWSDAQCVSGDVCSENAGGTKKGTCVDPGPVGSSCKENGDCSNDACGRETAAKGAALICCASGEVALYDSYDYCTEMPAGSTCWSDAECGGKDAYCSGNAGGTQRGTCVVPGPVGTACTEDAACSNSACGYPTAKKGATQECCASGATAVYAGNDYCTEMPADSICWSDAQCDGKDAICKGNEGGVSRGECYIPLPDGSKCKHNSDCANDACGRETAKKGASLICCDSGKLDIFDSYDYCTDMPKGSTCWSDDMCHDDKDCKGNDYGVRRGTCE